MGWEFQKHQVVGGKIKRWIGYTFIVCVLILFTELLSGYIVAQYGRPAEPAFFRAVRLLSASLNSGAANNLTDTEKGPILADNLNNPFMSNAPDSILVRLHPFIDFSNVHALSTDGTVSSTSNDFFGFRNGKIFISTPGMPTICLLCFPVGLNVQVTAISI